MFSIILRKNFSNSGSEFPIPVVGDFLNPSPKYRSASPNSIISLLVFIFDKVSSASVSASPNLSLFC